MKTYLRLMLVLLAAALLLPCTAYAATAKKAVTGNDTTVTEGALAVKSADTASSKTTEETTKTTKTTKATKTTKTTKATKTAKTKKAEKQKTVFVAAGHQVRGISARERLAPKGSATKAKLTSGTAGVSTHVPEYKTNLAIAKAVQKELTKRGYKVIMLRTGNKCALSNQQRTKKANKSGADIHICIHCDSAGSSSSGPHTCVPASSKYVGKSVYNRTNRLASLVLSSTAKAVGKRSHGTIRSNYYTTINWATIPTFILECGYMSNPREDRQLNSASYQKKLAKGIANGVDKYFK